MSGLNMMERMVQAMSFGKTADLKHIGALNTIWSAPFTDPDAIVAFMGVIYRDPKRQRCKCPRAHKRGKESWCGCLR